jgi:FkbM family methyltransferase
VSSPTIFIVAAFGRSGTVWLSKILNSNPEVMAYHEGTMKHVYPRGWFEAGMTETENYFGAIKHMAPWDVGLSTYAAVGDLNSFFGFPRVERWENEFYRAAMRPRHDKIIEGTRLSYLARNPIVVLESKRRVLKSNWDFFRDYCLWYGREMIELNRDALGEFDAEIANSVDARVFFMLCLQLRCAVRFGYPQIHRLEDLAKSPEAAAKACEQITGVKFDVRQIEAAHAKRDNVQTGSASYDRNDQVIWEQWPPAFQRMFARLCADLPIRLGYNVVTPANQVIEKVIGLDVPEDPKYSPLHYPITNAQKDHEFATHLKNLGFSPASVVDVGGSDGSWTRRIANLFPEAKTSIFEPLVDYVPKFQEGLESLTSANPNVSVYKVAMGDKSGKRPMPLNINPVLSSCLPPVGNCTYTTCVQVPVLTLDVAVRKYQIPPPTFLKISVNGFELQVLEGANETLGSVEVLFIETGLAKYLGPWTALLPEVTDWLATRGFYCTEFLDNFHDEWGLLIRQRVVFMREDNPYFKYFGQRRFHTELQWGLTK